MEETKKKIELSDMSVRFLTSEEANLLWNYDIKEERIWEKREEFQKNVRTKEKYVMIIDAKKPWFYNVFKPIIEDEKHYDVYASLLDLNCSMCEFNEWLKAEHLKQKNEALYMTASDIKIESLQKDLADLETYKKRDADLTSENLRLMRELELVRKDYGILKTDYDKMSEALLIMDEELKEGKSKKAPWLDPDLETGRAEMLEKVFGRKPENLEESDELLKEEEDLVKSEDPDWEEECYEARYAVQKMKEKYEKLKKEFWSVTKVLIDRATED